MTDKHDKYVCKTCGKVKEMDSGWAEARDPAPEVNMGSILPSPPDVAPVEKSDAPDSEYVDIGLGFVLGDCDDCGGHSWQRISFGSMEKEDPKVEKPDSVEDLPVDRGFQEIIPPSPEISQNKVMMQDTYTEPSKDPERPPREPAEPVEPGVSGAMATVPLGGEETNPNSILPEGVVSPAAKIEPPDTAKDETPKKEKYVCEKCGDIIELDLGQDVELPACVHCGSRGWLKESF